MLRENSQFPAPQEKSQALVLRRILQDNRPHYLVATVIMSTTVRRLAWRAVWSVVSRAIGGQGSISEDLMVIIKSPSFKMTLFGTVIVIALSGAILSHGLAAIVQAFEGPLGALAEIVRAFAEPLGALTDPFRALAELVRAFTEPIGALAGIGNPPWAGYGKLLSRRSLLRLPGT